MWFISVNELNDLLKRTFITFVCILVSILYISLSGKLYNIFCWGLLLGIITGLLNAFFLAKRVSYLNFMEPGKFKNFIGTGMMMRFALVLAMVFLASRIGTASFFGLITGLLLVPWVMVMDLTFQAFKRSKVELVVFKKHNLMRRR